jgi:hypothetical protein
MMMAATNTPNSAATAAPGKASVHVDVQQLTKKLLKHQGSRLAPSMGHVSKTGESGR